MHLLLRYLRTPATVGAVVPSSRTLAQAMSHGARGFEHIIELGAGTGAITDVLKRDHPRASLRVFERDAAMAERLKRRMPELHVTPGCVRQHRDVAPPDNRPAVIVSSLPFRSLPPHEARAIAGWLQHFLRTHPGHVLIQFTYGLREPFALDGEHLQWVRQRRVWRNLPPATVWELRQRRDAGRQRASSPGDVPSSTGQSRM